MENVGNSFSLPFKSRDWFTTFLLIGLIGLIPIIGWINLLGWMLALIDNYRAGRIDLPPPGFQYIARGANLFVVALVYGIALVAIFLVPFFFLLGGAIASYHTGSYGASTGFSSGIAAYSGLAQLLQLVLYLFYPAVIVATERGGIGGGLNVGHVFRLASTNWKNTVIAGLLIFVAGLLGALGFIACCIGIIVTIPYSYAVIGGIVRYYEAEFDGPLHTPPNMVPPPPPPPTFAS